MILSKLSEATQGLIVEAIVWTIGWLICMTCLAGTFAIGHWVATSLTWRINPDVAGLLSALSLIWLYEHRHFDTRLDRMR